MKREVFSLLIFISILFVFPILQAQEQIQTYSSFERIIDNVKMFFSSGDNKVMLALEIREKEVNSAVGNFQNGNEEEALKNLERAKNRLQIVQEKVSSNAAEAVEGNIQKFSEKLIDLEVLSEDIQVYRLEEEKTKLITKLIIELEGKEGQTLTREIVRNGTTGKNTIKIVVVNENGEEIITETQGQIEQIQNQIAERVVKIDMAKGVDKMEKGESVYVARGDGSGGDMLEPEIKRDIEGGFREEPLPEPNLNAINPELYNPNANIPKDIIDEGEEGHWYAEGTTAEGENNLAP